MSDNLSLIETIAKHDMFSVFSRLMGTSGANEIFSQGGEFTVFAPTNDAFGKIPDRRMDTLLNEKGQIALKALLSYHIVPGRISAADLSTLPGKATVSGEEVRFSDSGGPKVNNSGLLARNIAAANGLVHALDTVLELPIRSVATSSVL
jgi:uncharacterized surface protein with fasciclin (FAS1) repeats